MLNDQLVQLLRRTLESRQELDEPNFPFCPVCGETLAEYEQLDSWVRGFRCQSGHSSATRGGRLFSNAGGMN